MNEQMQALHDDAPKAATITVEDREYMRDARGHLVPIENVMEVDILRDQTVRGIVKEVEFMSTGLRALKAKVFRDADAFLDLIWEKYGVKQGGKKGNVTLLTYDGEYKIAIEIQDMLGFDERLQAAKHLIDTCIHKWAAGANDNLKVLVNDAFRVDKKGNVDTKRILELRTYKIDDEDWGRAMAAIGESIKVTMSRRYIRVYRRSSDGKTYRMIPLDFASI